jgi:hypothetical protein
MSCSESYDHRNGPCRSGRIQEYNGANLHYGTLARLLAERLAYIPEKRKDGSERWWRTLSYGRQDGDDSKEHFEFIMRPELVAAIQEMRWA